MKNLNEKILVVCDRDSRYANGLGENISERKELALQVYICTSAKHTDHFGEDQNPDILIVDESFSREERENMCAAQTFVLTKEKCPDLGVNEKEIRKYQSADRILGEVFETYYNRTNDSVLRTVRKPRQRLVAVYSPVHRVGKTSFAIAYGKELAKTEHVLYLNLEVYPDVNHRLPQVEGRNLGDLLYYMRQEESDLTTRLACMVEKQEALDVLPPMLSSTDFASVTSEEWNILIEGILDKSFYETVVLDVGEGVQGLLELLFLCDEIYMPTLEDEISQAKVAQFYYNLERQQLTALQDKIHCFLAQKDMEACAKLCVKEERKYAEESYTIDRGITESDHRRVGSVARCER